MTATLRSLALRLPLLVGGIVLAVALVTGQLVRQEITAILVSNAEQQLLAGAEQVSGMVGGGFPAARERLLAAGADPQVRAALLAPADSARLQTPLQALEPDPSNGRALIQLFDADGALRESVALADGADTISWGRRAVEGRALPADQVTIGPLVSFGTGGVGFTLAVPLRDDGGALLGWLVEVRRLQATNVGQVLGLLGVERLFLGSLDGGVWSDFATRVPGPPISGPLPGVQRTVREDSVAVLGVLHPVEGTPWLLWVEEPLDDVLAPMRAFLRRLWMAVFGIAILGATAAWGIGVFTARRIRHVAGELDRTLAPQGPEATTTTPGTDELRTLERSFAALEERVAKRRQLDAQLLQSQKLEAVGRLAGGIAHDFNNLLTVMANYGALVAERLQPNSPEARDLAEVQNACDRASALTRQLLAFSRQRLQDVRVVDLNAVVQDTDRLIARLIPSNVDRRLELGTDVPAVRADAVQLEQIILNLVVNAVDAMPEGGRLTLRTSRERLDPIMHEGEVLREGGVHACLAISDTGIGMDAATMARIFDPFFTTKPPGKGTGLGLATVHGIVQEAGGRVWPYSEPGQGTTLKVYLPEAPEPVTSKKGPGLPITAEPLPQGLVLVAEDDAATRSVLTRLLARAGHEVHAVERADDALAWLRGGPEVAPMAVVCDVMMPGMNGVAFAGIVQGEFPQLPVLLISGYSDVRERLDASLRERVAILEKPFTAMALYAAIRRAVGLLEGRGPSAPSAGPSAPEPAERPER